AHCKRRSLVALIFLHLGRGPAFPFRRVTDAGEILICRERTTARDPEEDCQSWLNTPQQAMEAAAIMENGRPSGVKHRMMCVGIPSSVMADYKQWECSYENSASHLNLLSDLKLCRCEV